MKTPEAAAPTARRESGSSRSGRPVDHSKDDRILSATLDLLADRDSDRVTLDEVAARTGIAKTTLYRRWATKEDLLLAAIRSAGRPPEVDALPDLGSLRPELLAVIDSDWLGGTDRRLAVFAHLGSAARTSPRLAPVIESEVTLPYVDIYRRLLQRAIARHEVAADLAPRIPTLATVVPALSTHLFSARATTATRSDFVAIIDDVLLPALSLSPPTP